MYIYVYIYIYIYICSNMFWCPQEIKLFSRCPYIVFHFQAIDLFFTYSQLVMCCPEHFTCNYSFIPVTKKLSHRRIKKTHEVTLLLIGASETQSQIDRIQFLLSPSKYQKSLASTLSTWIFQKLQREHCLCLSLLRNCWAFFF